MSYYYGRGGGRGRGGDRGGGPWPGNGPFSHLPPWDRPGWLYGPGSCWVLGYRGNPQTAPTTPTTGVAPNVPISSQTESQALERQKEVMEQQIKSLEESLNRIEQRLEELED